MTDLAANLTILFDLCGYPPPTTIRRETFARFVEARGWSRVDSRESEYEVWQRDGRTISFPVDTSTDIASLIVEYCQHTKAVPGQVLANLLKMNT